jgi:hypothetical protein
MKIFWRWLTGRCYQCGSDRWRYPMILAGIVKYCEHCNRRRSWTIRDGYRFDIGEIK